MFNARLAALALVFVGGQVSAEDHSDIFAGHGGSRYEVTITNITQAQSFTPQ